ncbi:HIT family protein [Streptomyces sp. NBC_01716]|uniref:HIT family protein n=1 Tax=Streptomyces sp. NBC_01716 TaxID=2975917 RepID=UPI002E347BD2|nr:HIT family protein [Streptomyces sp. NBC_01716]
MPDQPEPTNSAAESPMAELIRLRREWPPGPAAEWSEQHAASGVQPDTRPVPECLFCQPGGDGNTVIAEAASAYLRLDNYPSADGHMEVVPKRHMESFFDLTSAEVDDVYTLACDARAHVPDADGWTIGINEGRAAGRTIDHVHVHLIPRRHGDVADPRGGVRWVLPDTAALPDTRRCCAEQGNPAVAHSTDGTGCYAIEPARPDTERRERYAAAITEFVSGSPEGDADAADAALAVADEEQRDLYGMLRAERGQADGIITRLRAELESANESAQKALEQRQEMAEERYVWQERGDRAEALAARLRAELEQARATVLRERADFYDGVLRDSLDPDSDPRYCTAIHDIALGLRRLAAETAAGSGGQAESAHPDKVVFIAEYFEHDRWTYLGTSDDRPSPERLRARTHGLPARVVRATTTYTVEDGAQQPDDVEEGTCSACGEPAFRVRPSLSGAWRHGGALCDRPDQSFRPQQP